MADDDRNLTRALEIFSRALELDAASRDAFVDDACGDDAALRAEIASLLAARTNQGEFLASPSRGVDVTREAPPPLSTGESIGPYKLLEPLGEGGFGVVYRAEQLEPVRRQVALKVIKLGMDSEQIIARFELERQALAMMDHPNIATVLDAGTTDGGRPYFVMELVRGEPITKFCDQHQFTVRKRLELFRSVCNAVQHAHQKGIIHRDLKPNNVLVSMHDGQPVAKVIDFGIAKATSSTITGNEVFTEFRQFIGTPEYMSPEQAESELDIDTRADVYSLGVLLYELLTGVTPFDGKSLRRAALGEILRIIREETPSPPSNRISTLETLPSIAAQRNAEPRKLSIVVRGDLDWIVMKALEKDRARRYETATSLSEDIGRYLADEPVLASPPSRVYRLMKLVRRNKRTVAAMVAITVLLIAGVAGTTIGLMSAMKANDALDASLKNEEKERRAAELARDETEAVVTFLSDMLAAADPAEQGRDVEVREVLDRASIRVGTEFSDRPLVEARLRHTMANTYRALGLYEEAEKQIRRAEKLRGEEHGATHPSTLESQVLHALILWGQGDFERAEAMFGAAIREQENVLGKDDPATLTAESLRADALLGLGRWGLAEEVLRDVLRRQSEALGTSDPRTLRTCSLLGLVQARRSFFTEAEELLTKTFEEQKDAIGEEHPDTLATAGRLAALLLERERFVDAKSRLERLVEVSRSVFGDEHPETLLVEADLIRVQIGMSHFDSAGKNLDRVLAIRQRISGVDHPESLALELERGLLLTKRMESDAAIETFDQVLPRLRRAGGETHPRTIISMVQLASSFDILGRLDRAIPLAESTFALAQEKWGPDHRWTLKSMWALGVAYSSQGRFVEAEVILTDLRDRRQRVFGKDSPASVHALGNLGILAYDRGDLEGAVEIFEETSREFRRIVGPDDPRVYGHMRMRAVLLRDLAQYELAELVYDECLAGYRQLYDEDHPEVSKTLSGYAELQKRQGNIDRAEEIWLDVLERRRRVAGPLANDTMGGSVRLMNMWMANGKEDRSSELVVETLRFVPKNASEKNELAWFLLTCLPEKHRDPRRALKLSREANDESNFENGSHLDTLAAALFELGDVTGAVKTQRTAVERSPIDSRERFRKRLEKYEAARD